VVNILITLSGSKAQETLFESESLTVLSGKLAPRALGSTVVKLFNITDQGCSAIFRTGEEYEWLEYGKDLEVISKVPLNPKVEALITPKDGEHPWGFFEHNGQLMYLRGFTDYKNKKNEVILFKLSPDQSKDPERIVISTIEGSGFYNNMRYAGLFMKHSSDHTKILISLKLGDTKSKTGDMAHQFRFVVLDNTLEKMWEHDHWFTDPKSSVNIAGYSWGYGETGDVFHLNNQGDIYTWAKLDRGSELEFFDRYVIRLLKIRDEKMVFADVDKPASVDDVEFELDDNRFVMVSPYAGGNQLYSSWLGSGDYEALGMEIVEWDGKTDSKVIQKKQPFTLNHLTINIKNGAKEQLQKTADKGKKPLSIKFIRTKASKILSDGSFLFIATHTESIHVFRFNREMNLIFSTQVPFFQLPSANGSGFDAIVSNEKMTLLFNDRTENTPDRDWSKFGPDKFSGDDSQLTFMEVDLKDASKRQHRVPVWLQRKIGGLYQPGELVWNSSDKSIAYYYLQGGHGKQRLIKFSFQ
jgi:hypothetical protein